MWMYARVTMVYLILGKPFVVPKAVELVADQDVLRETVEERTVAKGPFQERTRRVTTSPL